MEKFPSFFEQIKNISDSNSTKEDSENNLTSATESVQEERWNICDTCNHNYGGRCQICGCGLSYLIKDSSSMCPIMKWSRS